MSVPDRKLINETGVLVEHKFETYLDNGQNISRAQSKHTSSPVDIYLEHGRSIPRARSKHTSTIVEKHRLSRGYSESKRKLSFKY